MSNFSLVTYYVLELHSTLFPFPGVFLFPVPFHLFCFVPRSSFCPAPFPPILFT